MAYEQGKESDITLAFLEDQAALLRSESRLWKTGHEAMVIRDKRIGHADTRGLLA